MAHQHPHHTHFGHPEHGEKRYYNEDPAENKGMANAFYWGVGLNVFYVICELIAGYYYNSIALISDAVHNISDVIGLVLSLIGFKLAQVGRSAHLSYGLGKSSILAALINALMLLVAMAFLAYEGVSRIIEPHPVMGLPVALVATIGIVINTITALMINRFSAKDINAKSAFVHLAADAGVSAAVVVCGIVMIFFNVPWLDGAVTVMVASVVVYASWGVFRESLVLSLDGIPSHINIGRIKEEIEKIEGVTDAHHIHIWALSSEKVAFTAHIKTPFRKVEELEALKEAIKQTLSQLGIGHATIEFEYQEISPDIETD